MSHTSGLAAAIRGSTESDTFDLAGQTPATITTNVTQAFREPLPLDNMIRITFVTGAGKLARQKYDEGAAKAVTSALRDLGFEEDRGASCINQCAGSFKLQHDTGKNLKTVVVFPRIQEAAASKGGDENTVSDKSLPSSSLLKPGSPEEMIALSPINMFENLIKSKCPTWSQKKGCNVAISTIQNLIGDLEQRLLQGHALDDKEQALYDAISVDSLEKKHNTVKDMMHQQVESGNITEQEKKQLLSQVSEKLETLDKELAVATDKPKKAEKLNQQKNKLEDRKKMLTNITPTAPPPLKHQGEILQLRKELVPLINLEESTKGRLLSVKETQSLARKDEILEEISQLERDSRGWFEDDGSFALRVERCRAVANSQSKSKKGSSAGKSTGGAKTAAPSNPWISASSAKPRTTKSAAKAPSANKKKQSGVGGVFAQMMLDDSDDE